MSALPLCELSRQRLPSKSASSPGAALALLLLVGFFIVAIAPNGLAADYQEAYTQYKQALTEKDLEKALLYARKAHTLAQQELGPRHARTGILSYNLGAVSFQLTRYRDALVPLQQAVSIYSEVYGPESEKNLLPLGKLAETTRALGALPWAERHWTRSVEILEINKPRTSPEITEILLELLEVAQDLGEAKRMRSYSKRVLYNLNAAGVSDSVQMGGVHISLAMAEIMLGNAIPANKNLERAIELYETHLPPDDSKLLDLYAFAADAFEQTGRPGLARKCRRKLKESES
ncbi:MAG: tetratricopeptide repeat protein [Myxococcota bacterium]|nr:tetratricopeptide repeat protein [Myxococcota bacterium]